MWRRCLASFNFSPETRPTRRSSRCTSSFTHNPKFADIQIYRDGEDSDAKEQILNLVNFLANSLEAKQLAGKVDAARAAGVLDVDTTLSELVRSLLDLASIPTTSYSSAESTELAAATSYSVQAAVRLMSTQAFSEAVLWLLDLSDPAVQASALGLLRTRLPTIKPARRGDISPAVVSVVERLRVSLADPETDLDRALATLDVVASSIFPDEDTVLAKTVPDLIALAGVSTSSKAVRLSSMEIMRKLAYAISLQASESPSDVFSITGTGWALVSSLLWPKSFPSRSRCSSTRSRVR